MLSVTTERAERNRAFGGVGVKRQSFTTFYAGLKGPDRCPENSFEVEDATGLSHDGRLEAIASWLGFCGCGSPEAALSALCDLLETLDLPWEDGSRQRMKAALCPNDGLRYALWYYLTEAGLLEHGTSVPGWLTGDGKNFVREVRRLLSLIPSEESP